MTDSRYRTALKKIGSTLYGIGFLGIPVALVGLLLENDTMFWCGMIMAIPAYVFALPLFCFAVFMSLIVWPFWIPHELKKNGAPFTPGDLVQVTKGPHRDNIFSIYEVWKESNQVRLNLGQLEKIEVTDVFSMLSIRRVKPES